MKMLSRSCSLCNNKRNKMELKTAIEILEYHQEWRLGKRDDMIHEPKKLTEAIDIVLSEVKKLHISDVMNRIESLMDEYKQAKINITKCDNSFDYDNLDRRISTLRYLFIEIDVWKYVS